MKIMIAGDWHGNTQAAIRKIYIAKENGCERIYQVGDFGLWPGQGGASYLKALNRNLVAMGIELYWLDGNHEWHDKLDRMRAKYGTDAPIRTDWDSIKYLPRGYRWNIGETSFMAVGGAVSIDKERRLETEATYGKAGKCWWPQEQLREDEAELFAKSGDVDIVLCHDCPADVVHDWMMIPNGNYKLLNESHSHRVRLQSVIDGVKPKWVIHGHLHYPYHKLVSMSHGEVHVVGLNMESDNDSHIFFDTDEMKVLPAVAQKLEITDGG